MNVLSSAAALISTIVAGLALMFVRAGSESLYFEWAPSRRLGLIGTRADSPLPELEEPMTLAEARIEGGHRAGLDGWSGQCRYEQGIGSCDDELFGNAPVESRAARPQAPAASTSRVK